MQNCVEMSSADDNGLYTFFLQLDSGKSLVSEASRGWTSSGQCELG